MQEMSESRPKVLSRGLWVPLSGYLSILAERVYMNINNHVDWTTTFHMVILLKTWNILISEVVSHCRISSLSAYLLFTYSFVGCNSKRIVVKLKNIKYCQ